MRVILPTWIEICPVCKMMRTFSALTDSHGREIGKFCIVCEYWVLDSTTIRNYNGNKTDSISDNSAIKTASNIQEDNQRQ